MSYHTFVEQRVKTFERLGGMVWGQNVLLPKRQEGETSTRGLMTRGELSWGRNALRATRLAEEMIWGQNDSDSRRQYSNMFYH